MASASEIAQWMVQRLHEERFLYQEVVVHEIADRFGKEFTYTNDSGGWSISREVLKEFRRLTEGNVVWERGEKLWRKRETHDEPGRRQD